MIKYLIIYILILLTSSCDDLGLGYVTESFNYYDFVKYGWVEFLEEEYDASIDFFQQALSISDIDQDGNNDYKHQSSYVGLSWAKTYRANLLKFDNNVNVTDVEIEELREEAVQYLCYYQDLESLVWNIGDCDVNLENIQESNSSGSVFYGSSDVPNICDEDYCCNDCFIKDKEVALIFYNSKQYDYYLLPETKDEIKAQAFFETMTSMGLEFLNANNEYDFIDGKPLTSSAFNLNRNSIVMEIVRLYLSNAIYNPSNANEYLNLAASILNENAICNGTMSSDNFDAMKDCISIAF